MSSEQDKDLVAKKKHVACRAGGAGSSDHISFRAESGLSEDPAPLAQYAQRHSLNAKCPFGNLLIPESVE